MHDAAKIKTILSQLTIPIRSRVLEDLPIFTTQSHSAAQVNVYHMEHMVKQNKTDYVNLCPIQIEN